MRSGVVIYAESPPDDAAVENAKQWAREAGHTPETVRIVKDSASVRVVAK